MMQADTALHEPFSGVRGVRCRSRYVRRRNKRRLILRSGVMALGSCDQGSDEGTEEGFAAFSRVVNELEEAEAEGRLLLGDAPMRPEPSSIPSFFIP